MTPATTPPAGSPPAEHEVLRVFAAVVALLATTAALLVSMAQVEVADDATGATRACGSALDGIVDRTGWESWWAADLDDPEASARSTLVRTTRCPGAINRRIVVAGALAGICGASLGWVAWTGRRGGGRAGRSELARLGAWTTAAGVALTAAGVLALLVLVADGRSTLFLYVDRLVVAVVGLLVLVPPIALLVIGRALTLVSRADQGVGDRS